MKIKKIKILPILMIFFITGCAIKEPQKPQTVNFTVISPMIKLSDAGFLRISPNSTRLQVYNTGVSLLEISITDRVCMNGVCKDELKFNEEFFGRTHYRGFFKDILAHKPIYNKKNLVKTNCGFDQNLSHLTYKFCNNKTFYKDTKNNIKIVIREID